MDGLNSLRAEPCPHPLSFELPNIRHFNFCILFEYFENLIFNKYIDKECRCENSLFWRNLLIFYDLLGILSCWMGQADRLEAFKGNQSPENALHVKFDLDTGLELSLLQKDENYGHLQLDVVSLYLLFLVQAIASGLQIVGTSAEVAFVQNLVFYVERAYRTPDFG